MKVVHYEPAEGHSQGDLPRTAPRWWGDDDVDNDDADGDDDDDADVDDDDDDDDDDDYDNDDALWTSLGRGKAQPEQLWLDLFGWLGIVQ